MTGKNHAELKLSAYVFKKQAQPDSPITACCTGSSAARNGASDCSLDGSSRSILVAVVFSRLETIGASGHSNYDS